MASFYFPFTLKISNTPVIVYPCIGTEKVFDRKENGSIEKYLNELYETNAETIKDKDNYHIVILWENEGERMADVWLFGKPENWHSGPLADVKIFQNLKPHTEMGVSAGDGLIMLGAEELHRRSKKTFKEYLQERPELPEDIQLEEEFYL
jgi:hypothetical protein